MSDIRKWFMKSHDKGNENTSKPAGSAKNKPATVEPPPSKPEPMGRKKIGGSESVDAPVPDLKSVIHQHALFFDKLVELIPARFYISTDDDKKTWFQGLSKQAKASAKKESIQNIKKARRDRLDPEKSSKTTLDLLKQSLEKEKKKEDEESEDDENDDQPLMAGVESDDRSITYEELRQKLHRKIEELRAGRGNADSSKKEERHQKRLMHQNKRKREMGLEENKSTVTKSNDEVEKEVMEASKDLVFSRIKWGDEEESGKKKKQKLSKVQELQKAMKLADAKKDPEKGEIIAKKHSWKAAMSKAAGIKIHDDPKLLKRSLHKEKKKREKNSQKWKERVESQSKMKKDKQTKRSENISGRIQEKKNRRIAKREKKLMRPGFEGRKEGFINKDQS